MTELTDNEVIALFDGFQFYDDDPQQFPNGYYIHPEPGTDGHTADTLEYHSSFDWLMPVWYKFRDLKLEDSEDQQELELRRAAIGLTILYQGPSPSEACKLLAEGIRWYNSVKK